MKLLNSAKVKLMNKDKKIQTIANVISVLIDMSCEYRQHKSNALADVMLNCADCLTTILKDLIARY